MRFLNWMGSSREVYDVYCQNPDCGREITGGLGYVDSFKKDSLKKPGVYCQPNCVLEVSKSQSSPGREDETWYIGTLANPKGPEELQRAIRRERLVNYEKLEKTVNSV